MGQHKDKGLHLHGTETGRITTAGVNARTRAEMHREYDEKRNTVLHLYAGFRVLSPLVIEGLDRYMEGIPTGSFLRAVLEGDLFAAAMCADAENLTNLGYIVKFIYYTMPSVAYGSPERVKTWLGE